MTTELTMTPFRATALLRRFKHDEKMLGPNEQAAIDFAISAITALTQRPAAQEGEVDIKSRVSELIAEHGTLRAAARSLNIDVGYLSRLAHGDKVHPSSETLAKIGLRDAGVKYQRLVFLPTQPAAQAGEVDDGDVTGQPGPLPETGWDEVPEDAFRKPSPTAGMNLGERIKHVGGRENAAGYIEFGSVAAVRALVRQYLRDLPVPQQATPAEKFKTINCQVNGIDYTGEVRRVDENTVDIGRVVAFADEQATPEPVGEPLSDVVEKKLRTLMGAVNSYEKATGIGGAYAETVQEVCNSLLREVGSKVKFGAGHENPVMPTTRPAPDVPEDVQRDAERYRFIRDANRSDCITREISLYAMESLDEYVDAAMEGETAAQAKGGVR